MEENGFLTEENGDNGGMRKAWAISFAALGVFSLAAQVLVIRELLIVFQGNEFFIGWTLFAWLFWVGAGALLGDRWLVRTGDAAGGAVAGHLGSALLLPVTLAGIRWSRTGWGTVPGAVPDLLPSLGVTLAILAPMCLVLGAQFVAGVRGWRAAEAAQKDGRVEGMAYAWETAGFVVGGVMFSWMLVVLNEFHVAGMLGAMNAVAALGLLGCSRGRCRGWRVGAAGVLAAMVGMVAGGGWWNLATAAWRFPGQELVESRQSIYGNLAVTAMGGQRNFFENGILLGAEDEQMASEQRVHLAMLWHPDPQRVLLLGGGFTGVLREILRHGPERVDHVELDPLWREVARRHVKPELQNAMDDPRVNTIHRDGRAFLHERAMGGGTGDYDVVIVNLPNPSTVLLNRYYSMEFYEEIRRQLAPGGVLAVRLAFSPDYLGPELEDLGASIDRTLRRVFRSVAILPEYEILYLATEDSGPAPGASELVERYRQRGLDAAFVVPSYIEYRMSTDRIRQVGEAFHNNRGARINRDGQPMACYTNFAYWLRSFHPRGAAFVRAAGRVRWPWGVALAAVVLAMGVSVRGGRHRAGPWAMGVGSFTLMACELVILLMFQVVCGHLYYKLAQILAVLMLGMAAGAWAGIRMDRCDPVKGLAGIHAAVAGYAVLLAGGMEWSPILTASANAGVEGSFLAMAAGIGGLVGMEFPLANRAYLAGAGREGRAGRVYGVDLLGSCLGALLIGLWALPVLGAGTTLVSLAVLNALVAGVCASGLATRGR